MKIVLDDFSGGVNYDKKDYETPVNQFTDVSNVTFREGRCQKALGYSEAYTGLGIRPQAIFNYTDSKTGSVHWIYPGINDSDTGKIYTVTGTTHTDRTQTGNYSPDGLIPWTGGTLNGLFIVNNGVNKPQKWDRTAGTLNAAFEDLANWPDNTTARVIRPFREFLIAMDVSVSTNNPSRNPYRVMWSDAAEPFTEPSSWVAAADNLAGDIYLSEDDDYVIDGAPLRGNFIIYKENSTHVLRYVGGNDVFVHDALFSEHGILAARCVTEFMDGMHFVVTKGNIIAHDGNTFKSIADDVVRKKIFSEIDSVYYRSAFCVPFHKEEEIWFCYPTSSTPLSDKAAIWNYKTGAWTFRSVPNVPHINYGIITTAGSDWDSDAGAWDDDFTPWRKGIYNPSSDELLIASRGETDTIANAKLYQADSGNTKDGVNMTCFARKTGIDAGTTDIKHVSKMYPKVRGGPVKFRTGSAMSQLDNYTWGEYQEYNPQGGDWKLDIRTTGRFLGFEIYSDEDVDWGLDSITFESQISGQR